MVQPPKFWIFFTLLDQRKNQKTLPDKMKAVYLISQLLANYLTWYYFTETNGFLYFTFIFFWGKSILKLFNYYFPTDLMVILH